MWNYLIRCLCLQCLLLAVLAVATAKPTGFIGISSGYGNSGYGGYSGGYHRGGYGGGYGGGYYPGYGAGYGHGYGGGYTGIGVGIGVGKDNQWNHYAVII